MRRPFYELQASDTPAPIACEALARIAALYAAETHERFARSNRAPLNQLGLRLFEFEEDQAPKDLKY